jgi:selenocysteine lyase/cysteine desulfurase
LLLLLKPLISKNSFHHFDVEADYWEWVRQSYTVSSNITNLNNGGVSPQPKVVQDVFEQYNRLSNEGPSYYMWRILDKGREAVRQNLAELAGVTSDEIAIQRNATECLDTIIFGLNLEKGDEVIVTNYDYPNMRNAWLQREKRDGIKLIWISIPLNVEDDDAIVKLFTDAITSKTKIIHITHIINWTGQILPAKKIAAKAHEKNIEVVLDAAHTFAHLKFFISMIWMLIMPERVCTNGYAHRLEQVCLFIKEIQDCIGIWPIFPT